MPQPLWFRMWSEAKNDAKLDALSDAEFRCWFKLLCTASESEERGVIEWHDTELVAIETRLDHETMVASVRRMERLSLVEVDGEALVFPAFLDRQYMKQSDRPEATRERKQKQRVTPMSRECHASVTPAVTPMSRSSHAPTEQSREITEQSRHAREEAVDNSSLANFPDCLSLEAAAQGQTELRPLRAHIITALEKGLGASWSMKPANLGKVGAAIRKGCPEDCNGSEAMRCAGLFTDIIERKVAFSASQGSSPVGLIIHSLKEDPRGF